MPRPRTVSDETKRLRGTFKRTQRAGPMGQGRERITEAIPPPGDLDRAAQAEWTVHMTLVLALGSISISDLAAFRALAETAALMRLAYKAAMRAGPITKGEKGSSKTSPEWQAWVAANARYVVLLDRFGLNPAAARSLPVLPVRGQPLQVVA